MKKLLTVWTVLLVLSFAFGCVGEDWFGENGDPSVVDKDGDSFAKDVDCDDDDAAIYPGAKERENCIDDDCDGLVDEGTTNEDFDKDGYCPSTGDIGKCEKN